MRRLSLRFIAMCTMYSTVVAFLFIIANSFIDLQGVFFNLALALCAVGWISTLVITFRTNTHLQTKLQTGLLQTELLQAELNQTKLHLTELHLTARNLTEHPQTNVLTEKLQTNVRMTEQLQTELDQAKFRLKDEIQVTLLLTEIQNRLSCRQAIGFVAHVRRQMMVKMYNRRTVALPPGTNLLNIAKFVYSKKTIERLFNQIVVDMREEHLEALARGEIRHARWIHLRGTVAFLTTVVIHSGASVAVKVFKAVKGAWS